MGESEGGRVCQADPSNSAANMTASPLSSSSIFCKFRFYNLIERYPSRRVRLTRDGWTHGSAALLLLRPRPLTAIIDDFRRNSTAGPGSYNCVQIPFPKRRVQFVPNTILPLNYQIYLLYVVDGSHYNF